MKIKTQFSHYGKLSHSFYEEINMYQIDFHKPLHIHFIGIGGISMSGLAEILLGEEFKVSPLRILLRRRVHVFFTDSALPILQTM